MAQKLENLIDKDLLEDYDDELKKTYLAGGVVFDISAHKATGSPATPATFADLTAALGTNGANIPQNMRKGGMTVKFIKGSAQSQSNKYVQYRLTSQTFSTSEADWECIEDLPNNVSYFSGDNGDGIVPTDGIRGEDIVASSAISVNPDVVTAITGEIGSATTITLVVPNDSLRHVWNMFFTTASDGGATIVVPQGATLHVPSGYSIASGKTYEVRIIGVGNHYYLTCQEYN